MSEHIKPTDPEDVGVEEETPELAQIEPAHILANDARERLEAEGFTHAQIVEWAETYVTEDGATADVDDFIEWIKREES